ncbi:MAG: 4-hydroxythreonine-4-phosphate dehydrogenase PdxA [Candidatus Eisenbacteria bacterium]|nr:4-hydroxythreonine-4-phosphate dehydrogenase PdxA [Candidatus Eisenbacteria bacterium]
MGDPAGIGPEVLLRSLASGELRRLAEIRIAGSVAAMGRWSERLSMPIPVEIVDVGDAPAEAGRPERAGAKAALESIRTAAGMCLAGEADAMVTSPVSKRAISSLGAGFPGHTEFLAGLSGATDYVMTFVCGATRIALATTHLAIADVPGAITRELLVSKLSTLDRGLRECLGIARPVIAVAALNPHAGEGGSLGVEEDRVLVPAIREARGSGIDVTGPHPADALFPGTGGRGPARPAFDAALAMYHDQGTIPAKLLAGGSGVNITLGLPIVRTSVDHGTAFDIAGAGRADHRSMSSAIALAAEVALRRRAAERGRGSR